MLPIPPVSLLTNKISITPPIAKDTRNIITFLMVHSMRIKWLFYGSFNWFTWFICFHLIHASESFAVVQTTVWLVLTQLYTCGRSIKCMCTNWRWQKRNIQFQCVLHVYNNNTCCMICLMSFVSEQKKSAHHHWAWCGPSSECHWLVWYISFSDTPFQRQPKSKVNK